MAIYKKRVAMTNDLETIGANFVCDVDSITVWRFTIPENFSDIIVVWSGGCDSTALVLYLWEKYHKTINLVSIDYDRFGSSSNDLKSRNKLLNNCNYCQYSLDRKPCNNCASCEKHNTALKNCRRFKWKYFRLSN